MTLIEREKETRVKKATAWTTMTSPGPQGERGETIQMFAFKIKVD